MVKRFLVSGYGPSKGGVGRLVKQLLPEAKKRGYKSIIKGKGESAKILISQKRYLTLIFEIIRRNIDSLVFSIKCQVLNNAKVIFIHPQKSGFRNLFSLVRKNQVYLYVVDNSFFCVRSYNTDPEENRECLKCLNNIGNVMSGCKPFPIKMNIDTNIKYLHLLKKHADRIIFLVQNKNQELLLKKHFGEPVSCKVVGLDTGEIQDVDYGEMNIQEHLRKYIVYHGSVKLAKGISFFINLAKEQTDQLFFIPAAKHEVEKLLNIMIDMDNVVFKSCTWETGLKEKVIRAKLVINPSMWSAPIEGALIKSITFNEMVATVESKYGYEEDLKKFNSILRLNQNPKIASKQIRNALSIKTNNNLANRKKLLAYIKSMRTQNLFDCIEFD